jgi:hypothetical protein
MERSEVVRSGWKARLPPTRIVGQGDSDRVRCEAGSFVTQNGHFVRRMGGWGADDWFNRLFPCTRSNSQCFNPPPPNSQLPSEWSAALGGVAGLSLLQSVMPAQAAASMQVRRLSAPGRALTQAIRSVAGGLSRLPLNLQRPHWGSFRSLRRPRLACLYAGQAAAALGCFCWLTCCGGSGGGGAGAPTAAGSAGEGTAWHAGGGDDSGVVAGRQRRGFESGRWRLPSGLFPSRCGPPGSRPDCGRCGAWPRAAAVAACLRLRARKAACDAAAGAGGRGSG